MPEHAPISLLVLTHNNYDMLREWLDMAAKCATVKEILILDNGSTDQTKFMHNGNIDVGGYKTGVRVSVLHLHENIGVIRGRNTLATAATQPNIMFLDDDQFLSEDSIEKLYRGMVGDGLDAIGALACECNENGVGKEIDGLNGGKREYLGAGGLLIKRDVFMAVGGFDEAFGMAYCEDPDLTWRLVEAGYKIGRCPDHGIAHRAHSTLHNQTDFDNEKEHASSHKLLMEKWHHKFKKIKHKRLGILFVVHDKYDVASHCFASLLKKIDSGQSEIFVLLNGVKDQQILDLFEKLELDNVNVFKSDENRLCAPGREYLIQQIIDTGMFWHNDYYLFIDDDVELTSDHIEDEIHAAMQINDSICCVQGLLLNPNKTIQDGYSFLASTDDGKIIRVVHKANKPTTSIRFQHVYNCFSLGGFNAIKADALHAIYKYMRCFKAGYADFDYYFRIKAADNRVVFSRGICGIHYKDWDSKKDASCDIERGWRTVANRLRSIISLKAMWGVCGRLSDAQKNELTEHCVKEYGIGFDKIRELGFDTHVTQNSIAL